MRLVMSLLFCIILLFSNSAILRAADDSFTGKRNNLGIHYCGFPILSESPETGFAIGGMFTAYRQTDPALSQVKLDSLDAILIYTQKEQVIASLGVKKYFQNGRYLLNVNGGYMDFPTIFYGIGPDTDESLEEDYTLTAKSFQGSFLVELAPNLYLGPIVTFSEFGVDDQIAGGLLASGKINGFDGTTVAGGGFKLLWDTRDDAYLPQHGSFLEIQGTNYRKDWGSDENFSQLITSYRRFWPIRQTKTMAFMSTLWLSDGTVPFEMLPCLGGSNIMRGYFGGRYRDYNYTAVQGEYRFSFNSRFGGVAFAGLGEVAPQVDQFNFSNLRAAGGFGVRFRIDPQQKINLRIDTGYSENGIFTYISFMEAF